MQLGTDEFLIVTVLLDHAAKTIVFFAKKAFVQVFALLRTPVTNCVSMQGMSLDPVCLCVCVCVCVCGLSDLSCLNFIIWHTDYQARLGTDLLETFSVHQASSR